MFASLLHSLNRFCSDFARPVRRIFGESCHRTSRHRRSRHFSIENLEPRIVLSATAIGMNLDNITDFSSAWMFTDAFKESRPWTPGGYDTVTHAITIESAHPAITDSHGWPTRLSNWTNSSGHTTSQVLSTMMFDGLSGNYAAGVYHVQWDGSGVLEWGGDAHVVASGLTSDGHHFANLQVIPGNQGILMRIDSMTATSPIHDVHVWMPDYNGQSFVGQVWHPGASFSPFHPLYLSQLSPFKTLRFMQTEETVTSNIVHWSDRRDWAYETQQSGDPHVSPLQNGVAPEYIAELGNELNANIWVNMPHAADADYVRQFATLMHSTLKPNLKVYVEWSNEVWNGQPGFAPYQWISQQLLLPANAGVSRVQFIAQRINQDFDVWSQIYRDRASSLVRVVAGNASAVQGTASVLQLLAGSFDAVSAQAYVGPLPADRAHFTSATTADQVINVTLNEIPTTLGWLQSYRQLANQYSTSLHRTIQFVAYEGGAHLDGQNAPYQPAFIAATTSPRMYDVYTALIKGLNQVGLDLFMNYEYIERLTNNPYGVFGSLNYQGQTAASAPKYRALIDAIHANGGTTATQTTKVLPASPVIAGQPPVAATPAAAATAAPAPTSTAAKLPVLMVIANQDFYYQEYADTRASILAGGLNVTVAAANRSLSYPHPNSGQGSSSGTVMPDLDLSSVNPSLYSAIVFVGGWGASEYQYAFSGTYANSAYNGTSVLKTTVNSLINSFVQQNKYVAAICHGVTVLAWARVNGKSLLDGHHVTTYEGVSPTYTQNRVTYVNVADSNQVKANNALVFAPNSIGIASTAADDVYVEGKLITAENYTSARLFGQVIATRIKSGS